MKTLEQMVIDIATIEAGPLPRTWDGCSEQDKWQVAFSAGLLAALDEIRITLTENSLEQNEPTPGTDRTG